MRILFYNWAQFDDYKLRGGGVSVYLDGIISKLIEDHEVFFISSGQHYDFISSDPRIEKTENKYGHRVQSYRIINSPIKAPAHDAFCSLDEARSSEKMYSLFYSFMKKHNFDVFQINNLEGLTMDIFDLKKKLPHTKFLFVAHNYHLICPQIELFKNRKEICYDNRCGWDCSDCLGYRPDMYELLRYQRIGSFIERIGLEGKRLGNFIFDSVIEFQRISDASHRLGNHFSRLLTGDSISTRQSPEERRVKRGKEKAKIPCVDSNVNPSASYYFWRLDNVKTCNDNIDTVVAVSSQVKQVLTDYGVDEKKVKVLLNGTDCYHTLEQAKNIWNSKKNSRVTVAFFGYPIPSKGLDLLLDALLKINLSLVDFDFLVASHTTDEQKKKIDILRKKFHSISVVEGYRRQDVPSLMSSVTLGVIPSLWLETYCQTAAELIAYGSPVIISDTVGIKDLYLDSKFIFKSGSVESLIEVLYNTLSDLENLDSFWDSIIMPMSVEEYVTKLVDIYGEII